MKLTILANTLLAVIAIALAAASSTPDFGARTLEKISQDAHPSILTKRLGGTSL